MRIHVLQAQEYSFKGVRTNLTMRLSQSPGQGGALGYSATFSTGTRRMHPHRSSIITMLQIPKKDGGSGCRTSYAREESGDRDEPDSERPVYVSTGKSKKNTWR